MVDGIPLGEVVNDFETEDDVTDANLSILCSVLSFLHSVEIVMAPFGNFSLFFVECQRNQVLLDFFIEVVDDVHIAILKYVFEQFKSVHFANHRLSVALQHHLYGIR